ncbi:MAG: cell division protein FtsX [Cytophagaceae bacterium SCN 52-12]|nr:MAG: cell division protein FtsX [Cytophagaceae bacterium SCN 52-12]
MLSYYLKTAWRNLRRNKLFSLINIAGLSIGIATSFMIILYVRDELSYDRFNKNAGDIARVVFRANINGGKINESIVMAPVAEVMKQDFPEVRDAARMVAYGTPGVSYEEKHFKNDRVAFADPNFFDIFTLPAMEGNPRTALSHPNTVVLTKTVAEKYFGKESALGKAISINGSPEFYTVTAVINDIPVNSHFHFDVFCSMKGRREASSDSWMEGNFYTYLLLEPGTDREKLEARFPDMVAKYMGPQIRKQMGLGLDQFRTQGNEFGFALQDLTDIHLHSDTTNELEPGGNAAYVYIFAGIAAFMLIVACINFINLSTAGASKRAKEVGVRKVVGSGRYELIRQFLTETLLISLFALTVAYGLLRLALPAFGSISGKQLSVGAGPVLIFLSLGLTAGVLAGIYPAFYLSSFKPVSVLKGRAAAHNRRLGLRSGLVVFQFFISVSLIVGTVVVYQQMKYIQQKDTGYDREQLLVIPNSYALGAREKAFRQAMLQDPRVERATMSWFRPAGPSNYNNALAYPWGNDNLIVNGVDYHVDEEYIPTMGMKILHGRNFSSRFPTDSATIILNETAALALGWNAEKAVGETVVIQNSPRGSHAPFRVIGVVKNFNFKSLHEAISPLYMTLYPEGGLIFKLNTPDVQGVLEAMQQLWDSYHPEEPFTYAFMDDLYFRSYASEQKTATVLNIFAALTIFVACLGLFGLVTYTSEQRTREIGIRKVLGAGTGQVTALLSGDLLKLVLAGSLIAFPVAWWGISRWLESFAYHIELRWWMFALSGLTAMLIAVFTVSWKAVRAAAANPVESLRNE